MKARRSDREKIIAEIIKGPPRIRDSEIFKKNQIETDNDRRLADAIRNSSAKVVLGYFFQMDPVRQMPPEEYRRHQENVQGSRYQFVRFKSDKARKVELIEPALPQSNIPIISEATNYAGFFNMAADGTEWSGSSGGFNIFWKPFCPVAIMAAGAFLDAPPSLQIADYGIESLQVGRISVPVDEQGRMMINYRGGIQTFPHISVTDIIGGKIDEAALKGKIVVVGATAVGIYDLRVTPFQRLSRGRDSCQYH
jgi:adenylate cyclase